MAGYLAPSPRARILVRVVLGQLLAVWLLVSPILVVVNGALETGASWWSAWAFGGAVGTVLFAVPASVAAALLLLLDRRAAGPRWGWPQVILVLLLAPLLVVGFYGGDVGVSGATGRDEFLADFYPIWMAQILPGLLITQAMLVFPRIRGNSD